MRNKACSLCGQTKPLEDFHRNKTTRDGHTSRCKECATSKTREWYSENRERALKRASDRYREDPDPMRNRYYRNQYNITLDQYREMLSSQGGLCAICGTVDPEARGLAVDHDHACCPGPRSCGKCVRQLLCMSCNTGIGAFADDLKRMQAAMDYIRKHQG